MQGPVSRVTDRMMRRLGGLLRSGFRESNKNMLKNMRPSDKFKRAKSASQDTAEPEEDWEDVGADVEEEVSGFSLPVGNMTEENTEVLVPSVSNIGFWTKDSARFRHVTVQIVFQLLCRVVEGCVWQSPTGTTVLSTVLECVPLGVPDSDERLFGGELLSCVCKYLDLHSAEVDITSLDNAKNLVAFSEAVCNLFRVTGCACLRLVPADGGID